MVSNMNLGYLLGSLQVTYSQSKFKAGRYSMELHFNRTWDITSLKPGFKTELKELLLLLLRVHASI